MFIINAMMAVSNWIWGWPLLILTFTVAIFLSLDLRFFQFTMFCHAMKETLGKIFVKSEGTGDISPFSACCTALASTLGVGNIAGVSVAIATGGPGSIFWMWVVALLGLIVKFSEIALALAYREKNQETGNWNGGFYWYVRKGLGENWKWVGVLWAVTMLSAMVFAPAVQINSLASAINASFDINPIFIGIASSALMFVVLIGGIKSISRFAEMVVPMMAFVYTLVSLYVLVRYASAIPGVFALILKSAFNGSAASGGFAGAGVMLAIRWGFARGIYSNEAGTGAAPLAHASATVNHPAKQGLWGIVEVFVDTIIVCSMTALVVLCSGVWDGGSSSAALTSEAFGVAFGNKNAGTVFVSVIISFFAFTTALVNVYYGEICLMALGGKKILTPYRILGCFFAVIGAGGALSMLWNLFDFFYGVCVLLNLLVCVAMHKQIAALVRDYISRLKSGKWEETAEETVSKIPEFSPKR